MGIESYLLADSVVGVIAQRLVRCLCPKCKRKVQATEEEKELFGFGPEESFEVYVPAGCGQCNDTGFLGRTGVYEIMKISPRLKTMISRKASAEELKKQALDEGMNTLRMAAARLVLEGRIPVSEMLGVSLDS